MKTYRVRYRSESANWQAIADVKARTPAGAISQVLGGLRDVDEVLEISACELDGNGA